VVCHNTEAGCPAGQSGFAFFKIMIG